MNEKMLSNSELLSKEDIFDMVRTWSVAWYLITDNYVMSDASCLLPVFYDE
jgi:hypothetical protein